MLMYVSCTFPSLCARKFQQLAGLLSLCTAWDCEVVSAWCVEVVTLPTAVFTLVTLINSRDTYHSIFLCNTAVGRKALCGMCRYGGWPMHIWGGSQLSLYTKFMPLFIYWAFSILPLRGICPLAISDFHVLEPNWSKLMPAKIPNGRPRFKVSDLHCTLTALNSTSDQRLLHQTMPLLSIKAGEHYIACIHVCTGIVHMEGCMGS